MQLQNYNIYFDANVPETMKQQATKESTLLKNVQIWPEMTSLAIKHARRTQLRSLMERGFESKENFFVLTQLGSSLM